jgi:hypothetical protein
MREKDAPLIQRKDFDICDYSDGSQHMVHVISINNTGNKVEIEVRDYNEGEYGTFYINTDRDDERTDISSA